MAIQAKVTTIQGVSLDTAYINISNPQIIKTKTETGNTYKLGGNACVYVSKEAYDAGKIPLEGFSVVCDLDLTKDMFEQAYAELKKNTRLTDVEDC